MSHQQPITPKAPRASYYAAAPLASSKVDVEAGILRDVAIMTIGEAATHGERVDMATLQALFTLGQGKSVKAYMNHSCNPDPTEVIGVFTGFYIDSASGILRASQFTALKAWRTHAPQAFDTLFELASTAPDTFGISVVIDRDTQEAADGGYPYIRPTCFESADFVSCPSANKALFSKGENNALDVSTNQIQQQITVKQIYAKYSAKPEAIAYAVKLLAETDGMTEDKAIAETDAKMAADDAAAKDALIAQQSAKIAELEAVISALQPKEVEVEEMSKAKAETEAKLSAESAKVLELTAKLATANAQIATYSAKQRRFGTAPVKTGQPEGAEQPKATRAEFDAMSHTERNKFMSAGGKLSE